eukprot:COSAG06_NODE_13571_length_1244_cov_1.131878_3_plen_55_part_01
MLHLVLQAELHVATILMQALGAALRVDQGRGDEEPAFIEVEDEPPAAVAAAGSRR